MRCYHYIRAGETHCTLGLGRVNDLLFRHTSEPQTCTAWSVWGCVAVCPLGFDTTENHKKAGMLQQTVVTSSNYCSWVKLSN